ncbi:hypothetical protein KUTeg_011611 [Tegillarca granosa]|uniref:SH3 domain-containing protein n=1 Tax=Tegillarca granosa TaxID=220873 RepID=A0ABQ9F0M2_TEGGR|nr:hypothetical protein KUTeg_011611 [Tegillarca granosa]
MMSPESPPGGTQEEEDDGWSSGEFSNSDEDTKKDSHNKYSSPEPNYLQKFQSIGDYNAVDSTEVSLREGDMIQVLRTGSTGWWYARHMVTNQEGWVPSTFLQPALKAHSHLFIAF